MSPSPRWQFWIDVGGTFTDCVACHPDGTLTRHKLLSSGVTKGRTGHGSGAAYVADPHRQEPAGFFRGWRFRLSTQQHDGPTVRIVDSDPTTGLIRLDTPLKDIPLPNTPYELIPAEPAPVVAIRSLLGLSADATIPPSAIRIGTTRGTNALLTRRGATTALVTTKGFGDCLDIGYQARPEIFAREIRKPSPLASMVEEVQERIAADGTVLIRPDWKQVANQLVRLREAGAQSVGICFLHGDLYPEHELETARIAREVGFTEISVSHEIAAVPRLVARGDTTVLNAYLNPVLRTYVERLKASLAGSSLRILTSAGGLVSAEAFHAKDSILSGPAGGAVAFASVARACGFDRAIGLDMGGTSTDVARFDGTLDTEYETIKAGVRILTPMLAIETVAAGGGSVCRFDGIKLVVGPQSAGADPGPACYGRGGPLTVTDLNLYLGRIGADALPFHLDIGAVERRLTEMIEQIEVEAGRSFVPSELAHALLEVANANMAAAIRTVTIARGASAENYPLIAFGGAAPQHACAIAEQLQIKTIIIHPDAGILSALGAGLAEITRHREIGIDEPLAKACAESLECRLAQLEHEAVNELLHKGVDPDRVRVQHRLDMRYQGSDCSLTIDRPSDGDWSAAFTQQHREFFGYERTDHPIQATAVRVEASSAAEWELKSSCACSRQAVQPERFRSLVFRDYVRRVPVFEQGLLRPGGRLVGPAVVEAPHSTLVIDPGWEGEILTQGELVLRHAGAASAEVQGGALPDDDPDPGKLEIFNNLLAAIAEQMGHTLRRTAISVNIKERLDFSCAIFTADGRLVANAPHVPVHLGAMGETVRCIIADNTWIRPGDVYVTNDPYRGGSHLPDVTVITPVHSSEGGELLFFTASRGHHAEIGGISPGSMAPDAVCLAEEGVLIRNFLLVRDGQSHEHELRKLLVGGPFPSRAVEDNLADIRAQVAANRQGARDLLAMIKRYSWPVVEAYMQHVQSAASAKCRQVLLAKLPVSRSSFVDHIETSGGQSVPIRVTIERLIHGSAHEIATGCATVAAGSSFQGRGPVATIDFSGTAPVLASNLNANRAIVTAAVIYCLRLLIDEDIPLNDGVLEPVEIRLPNCLLNPLPGPDASTSPPVGGGNVETSQRLVDVILGAMGVMAASQGTMNNLILGDDSFGYYETICGGAGASEAAEGADAVQVHMTNTRITDPEILERRYPLLLWEFSIRRGSGGRGRHRGGHGAIREFEFLRPLTVSLLSGRRGPHPPYGLEGGEPGTLGRNLLLPLGSSPSVLPGICRFTVQRGDRLRMETPGGGGWGRPAMSRSDLQRVSE